MFADIGVDVLCGKRKQKRRKEVQERAKKRKVALNSLFK